MELEANGVKIGSVFPPKSLNGRIGNWTPAALLSPQSQQQLISERCIKLGEEGGGGGEKGKKARPPRGAGGGRPPEEGKKRSPASLFNLNPLIFSPPPTPL
jgi:hypothetical protein